MQFILQAFNTASCQDILELRLDPGRSGKAVRRGCVAEKIHTPFISCSRCQSALLFLGVSVQQCWAQMVELHSNGACLTRVPNYGFSVMKGRRNHWDTHQVILPKLSLQSRYKNLTHKGKVNEVQQVSLKMRAQAWRCPFLVAR